MLTEEVISLINLTARHTAEETSRRVLEQLSGAEITISSKEAMKMLNCGKDKLKSLRSEGVLEWSKGEGSTSPIRYKLTSVLAYKSTLTLGVGRFK